jgi:hypothetical protein
MATKEPSPAKPAPSPEALIECRVVGVNYGRALKGDIVRVPQREIDRLTRHGRDGKVIDRVLLPLEEEKKQIAEAHQPTVDRDLAEATRRKQAAWAENEASRRALLDRDRLARAKRVVESGGVEEE